MRGVGHEFMYGSYQLLFIEQVQLHLTVGAIAGLLFGNLDYVASRYVAKRMPFGKALFFGSVSYFLVIILFFSVALKVFTEIN